MATSASISSAAKDAVESIVAHNWYIQENDKSVFLEWTLMMNQILQSNNTFH
jgi:hypothetical protein